MLSPSAESAGVQGSPSPSELDGLAPVEGGESQVESPECRSSSSSVAIEETSKKPQKKQQFEVRYNGEIFNVVIEANELTFELLLTSIRNQLAIPSEKLIQLVSPNKELISDANFAGISIIHVKCKNIAAGLSESAFKNGLGSAEQLEHTLQYDEAELAMLEGIDNAIQETIDNNVREGRTIQITLSEQQLMIEDNGGVRPPTLKSWITNSPKVEVRYSTIPNMYSECEFDESCQDFNLKPFFTSQLSRAGAEGIKFALRTSGNLTVETKHPQNRNFQFSINASISTDPSKFKYDEYLKSVSATEMYSHFTRVAIENVAPSTFFSSGEDKEQRLEWLRTRIAHIYYYYIHGFEILEQVVNSLRPSISNISTSEESATKRARLDEQGNSSATRKAILPTTSPVGFQRIKIALNSTFLTAMNTIDGLVLANAAAAFPFSFRFSIENPDSPQNPPCYIDCRVKGVVFYYPETAQGEETLPISKESIVDNHTTYWYWNGRLLPHETLQPSFTLHGNDTTIPQKIFKRVKILIFVNNSFLCAKDGLKLMSSPALKSLTEHFAIGNLRLSYLTWLDYCSKTLEVSTDEYFDAFGDQ